MRAELGRIRRAVVVLALFLSIAEVHAQTLNYGVDAGLGETDNVTLAHSDKTSQTIAVTDFDVDYKQKSQRLDVDAKGNFSYLDFLQNAYGNELLGRFDGAADVALIPQRLTWALQDDFGKAAVNPFTPNTPTNLENINYVATGPDLYLRLGGASFLDLSARLAHTQYQDSPFTNTRATGSLGWGLKLSPISSVSVNGDTERVLFENTKLNTDFERSNAFVRYDLKGSRTEASVDLGGTSVTQSGRSTTGGLAKFKMARRLSASSLLTLALGHEETDGSTSFSGLQGGALGVVGTAPATDTSGTYLSNYASAGWEFTRNRTTLALSGRREEDTYPGLSALDRTLTSGELRLQRRLNRAFVLQVAGTLYKANYRNATLIGVDGNPYTDTGLISAAVLWRHGRALEVKAAAEHTIYAATPSYTGYRESRIFVTVGYRPFRESPTNETVPGG